MILFCQMSLLLMIRVLMMHRLRALFFFFIIFILFVSFLPNKNNVSSAVCCMCTNGILFVYARVPIFLNFYRRFVLYGPIVNVSH